MFGSIHPTSCVALYNFIFDGRYFLIFFLIRLPSLWSANGMKFSSFHFLQNSEPKIFKGYLKFKENVCVSWKEKGDLPTLLSEVYCRYRSNVQKNYMKISKFSFHELTLCETCNLPQNLSRIFQEYCTSLYYVSVKILRQHKL